MSYATTVLAHDPERTNYAPDIDPPAPPFTTRWSKSAGGSSSLLLADAVYQVASTGSDDSRIVGYALDDGRSRFRYDLPAVDTWSASGRTLYTMADEAVTALDIETERPKWSADLGGSHGRSNYTTPRLLATETDLFAVCHTTVTGDEDVHWFVSGGTDPPLVAHDRFGIDASETTIVSSLAGRRTRAYASVVVQNADDGGRLDPISVLMAVDRGVEDWRVEMDYAVGHVTLGPERVFCATPDTAAGSYGPMVVKGYETETGTRSWRQDLPSPATGTALGEGTLYLSLDDGVVALDASTGDIVWENYDVESTSGLTVAGETLLVGRRGRTGGELRALDTVDGTERWHHELEADVTVDPIVVEDAILIDGRTCLVSEMDGNGRGTADDSEVTLCPECADPVPGVANFCSNCGADLRTDACPECGSELDGGEAFCPACGHPLD
jgi:outer membrane protein assembly factor BamB